MAISGSNLLDPARFVFIQMTLGIFLFRMTLILTRRGGSIAQWLAYLLPDPVKLGLIPSAHKKISEEKIADVAEAYQRCSF